MSITRLVSYGRSSLKAGLLLVFLAAQSSSAWAMTAQEVVEKAANDVISVLDKEAEQIAKDPEKAFTLIEQYIVPYFDFDRMSYYILGNNWKNATEEQKARFQSEFKHMLVNTYATALSEYTSQEQINYLPTITSKNPDVVIVPTEISQQGSQPVSVAYRMFRQDDNWRIYDVAIGGISLVTNYRASFASQIRNGGMEGLLTSLSSHNERLTENSSKATTSE